MKGFESTFQHLGVVLRPMYSAQYSEFPGLHGMSHELPTVSAEETQKGGGRDADGH